MATEIVKRQDGASALSTTSLQEQMSLLREKFHLPETAIERNYVRVDWVPDPKAQDPKCRKAVMKGTAEAKHPGMKPVYVLCKRENPIRLFVDDSGRVAGAMAQGYADKLHLTQKRGKYSDEERLGLMNGFAETVEVKEVSAFAQPCV